MKRKIKRTSDTFAKAFSRHKLMLLVIVIVVLFFFGLRLAVEIRPLYLALLQLLRSSSVGAESSLSFSGLLLFAAVYSVTVVLVLPGFVLTYGAGFVFGFPLGILAVWSGAVIGASASFFLSRAFFEDWVLRKLERSQRYQFLRRMLSQASFVVVLLARLCPAVPFRFSNYAFGLSSISFRHYLFATALGVLPSASVCVFVGSKMSSILQLREVPPHAELDWLYLFLSAAVVIGLGLVGQRALFRQVYRDRQTD